MTAPAPQDLDGAALAKAESGKGDPGKAGPGKGGPGKGDPGTPDPDKGNLMPVNVECGEAITVDTALAADVGPCPADGIIIAVDGIVTWVTASPSRTLTTTWSTTTRCRTTTSAAPAVVVATPPRTRASASKAPAPTATGSSPTRSGAACSPASDSGHVCNPPPGAPFPPEPGNTGNIASGINFLQQGPATIVCPAFDNIIERNRTTANQSDGIFVAANSHDNRIIDNRANENGNDGIHLNGPRFATNFENVGPTVVDLVTPDLAPFTEGTDYEVMFGSGSGDVTDDLVAIDLAIPDDEPINSNPVDTSTSGCEASDFTDTGFEEGDVALIQRGTCTFVAKVDNAIAAGASAVIMFNEGQTGRTAAGFGSVGGVDIPVISASYALGQQLNNLLAEGEVTINVVTNTTSETVEAAPGAFDNVIEKNTALGNAVFDAFELTDRGEDDRPSNAAVQAAEAGEAV